MVDIVGSLRINNIGIENWYSSKSSLLRMFTIMSTRNTETLTLHIDHLNRMQEEFSKCFDDLIDYSSMRLKHCLVSKLNSLQICSKTQKQRINELR